MLQQVLHAPVLPCHSRKCGSDCAIISHGLVDVQPRPMLPLMGPLARRLSKWGPKSA